MRMPSLLSTALFILSTSVLALDPATGDSIARGKHHVKRNNEHGALILCAAVYTFDKIGCNAVGPRYYYACILVVEAKYQGCRRRASNDVPSEVSYDIPNEVLLRRADPSCDPACNGPLATCLKGCVSHDLPYCCPPMC